MAGTEQVEAERVIRVGASDLLLLALVAAVLLWVVPRQLLHWHRAGRQSTGHKAD